MMDEILYIRSVSGEGTRRRRKKELNGKKLKRRVYIIYNELGWGGVCNCGGL